MKHSLMFLTAISPVHNGAGEGLGMIDRPIIRERTTKFPIIQGSTLKGVLRDEYQLGIGEQGETVVNWLFGPLKDGSEHAGCVSFGDAAILAFPIRSLKGSFVWATSPLILYRFARTVEIAGLGEQFPKLSALLDEQRLHSDAKDVFINPDAENTLLIRGRDTAKIVLEEFPLDTTSLDELKDFASEVGQFIFGPPQSTTEINKSPSKKIRVGSFEDLGKVLGVGAEGSFKVEFEKKLVILPQDMFNYFVIYATEVVANIKIDDDTGTTTDGSLRYTEYLPSETILYSLASFEKPFAKEACERESLNSANKVRDYMIRNKPKDTIQIGGDETKGKGFVNIRFASEGVKESD